MPSGETTSERSVSHEEAIRSVRLFMKDLRGPWADANALPPASGYFHVPYRFEGQAVDLPLGWIGTRGCSWTRTGGCTMCDYGGYSQTASPDDVALQVRRLFEAWNHPHVVSLSALGSVLDPAEVPPAQQEAFFRTLGEMPGLRHVGIECRPEYVHPEVLQRVTRWLGPVGLDVGMGLESINETVRNVLLNKGLEMEAFERAVVHLREWRVKIVPHVFFKPPFMSEWDSILDAERTIRFCTELGPKDTILMLSNIKANTLTWWLWKRGEYRVPWLWSVLELVHRLEDEHVERLMIYGFQCGMPMLDMARNCEVCTPGIRQAIREFNYTGERRVLERARDQGCGCRKEWEGALERAEDVETRILGFVRSRWSTWSPEPQFSNGPKLQRQLAFRLEERSLTIPST